jgi:hypothetical protein
MAMIDPSLLAAPRLHCPYRVAVTGHRDLDAPTSDFVAAAFQQLLLDFQRAHLAGVVAVSGLAVGADTLFADAALALGIPLEVGLAAATILTTFSPGAQREHFRTLCAQSQRVQQLPFAHPSNSAYMALGRWLVDESDVVLAAWNGLPARAEGGTGDVVAYARQQDRAVVHIHTLQQRISILHPPQVPGARCE